ncbi:ras-related protein Rab-37-like [Watersipora subatra]|uniref:ras-related protein Rab-37-like n=1 Tax=Watersipora subatra TaxID=2589382 RepID=UPI00355B5FFF
MDHGDTPRETLDADTKHTNLNCKTCTDSDSEDEGNGLNNRKVIILGDSETGKTSLLMRFDQDKYCDGGLSATVGVGYANKIVDVDDNSQVKLQIWDTAGQERFRSITRAYYRDAEALLLVYDITNRKSYDNIKNWITEVSELAKPDVIIMLLGNKLDLDSSREVSEEDGNKIAQENKAGFTEASAKSGANVDSAFLYLAKQLHEKSHAPPAESDGTNLLKSFKSKSKCC